MYIYLAKYECIPRQNISLTTCVGVVYTDRVLVGDKDACASTDTLLAKCARYVWSYLWRIYVGCLRGVAVVGFYMLKGWVYISHDRTRHDRVVGATSILSALCWHIHAHAVTLHYYCGGVYGVRRSKEQAKYGYCAHVCCRCSRQRFVVNYRIVGGCCCNILGLLAEQ